MPDATALDPPATSRRRRFHQSNCARIENDRYDMIEAPLLIAALDDVVILKGRMLEPACGRGYVAAELRRRGFETVASDLTAPPNPLVPDIQIRDLRHIESVAGFTWTITNLPYSPSRYHDELARHLLRVCMRDGCNLALFVRLAYTAAERRQDILCLHPHFQGKLETFRPLWIPGSIGSPQHDFAWCVWRAEPRPPGVQPWLTQRGRAICEARAAGVI
jgi:hypothetical protein